MFVIPPAVSTVLMSAPASTVKVGHSFTVGVWWQSFSGGNRAYDVMVDSPSGRCIFGREGQAGTVWQDWNVRATQPGKYLVIYKLDGSTHRFTVTAKR